MSITFTPIDIGGTDRGEFTRFMTRDTFPFHQNTNPTDQQVAATIDSGRYRSRAPLWIDEREHGRIGVAVLDGLSDATLTFDLRLVSRYRRRGLGVPILRALTDHVFGTYPTANRLEGQTREDNVGMRKTFVGSGFVKESHHREGWPVVGGEPLASVGYAILRGDWASGTTTAVEWDDADGTAAMSR